MSARKNVSLPDKYEDYYEMLEESGVFREEFGGFSQFVQAMIEMLAEDKPHLLHDYISTKEEEWKAKRKQIEDQYDIDTETVNGEKEIEDQKVEFFENMLSTLKRMRKADESLEDVYTRLEQPWIKKYRRNFHHVNKKSFRNELESVLEKKSEVSISVTS